MTQVNRKRVRSAEDEGSEFTPLSKRINNLHINNLSKLSGIIEAPNDNAESEWINRNYSPSPNHLEPSHSSSSSDSQSTLHNQFDQDYKPVLNSNDNPYYYEPNKLLHSLYIERMRREHFNDL